MGKIGQTTTAGAMSWNVVAASVCGLTHECMGRSCQDAYAWTSPARELLVAAVADGAGSASHSEYGSAVAAQAAVNALAQCRLPEGPDPWAYDWEEPVECKRMIDDAQRLWGPQLTAAVEAANAAIYQEAARLNVPTVSLRSTLAVVVAMPRVVVAMNVGDAYVVLGDHNGEVFQITVPPLYEYEEQTDFLFDPSPAKVTRGWYTPVPPKYVAMFTDGLETVALKLREQEPYAPFFKSLFQFVETTDTETAGTELELFLRSSRIRERATDDLTLLLAHLGGDHKQ